MKALILAAGYATRLYPLTKDYPKSLLEAGGRSIIEHIIAKLERVADLDEIIVVTNNKFYPVFVKWSKELGFKKPLTLVNDLTKTNAARRGAVGDMDFVLKKNRLNDSLLVIGGDNLFDEDLSGFILFAKKNKDKPSIGVYNIGSFVKAKNYGVVTLDKNNRLVDFKEKPARPDSKLVAMCLYYFPKETLKLVGEYVLSKPNKADATGNYISWLKDKCAVYGFIFNGRWYDIGDYKFYNEAKEKFITTKGESSNA